MDAQTSSHFDEFLGELEYLLVKTISKPYFGKLIDAGESLPVPWRSKRIP